MKIMLEHNCVVWTEGDPEPKTCVLSDPRLLVFNIGGWLYSDNGAPLPTLLETPKITRMISAKEALDRGLRTEYDPNSGYNRRDEDGLRQ